MNSEDRANENFEEVSDFEEEAYSKTNENDEFDNSEDDWSLDGLNKTSYLQNRKSYFADNVYKIGAGIAAVLALIALYAMN